MSTAHLLVLLSVVLAAVLIGLWSATAAMVGTTVLSAVGAIVFVTSAGREQDVGAGRRPSANRLPVLAGAGIRTVVACSAGFGLTFGLLDVAFPAFARAHGSTASAGILLSAFAAGSLGGGFIYGLRGRAGETGRRYPWLS